LKIVLNPDEKSIYTVAYCHIPCRVYRHNGKVD
jgi:hypothetical protein